MDDTKHTESPTEGATTREALLGQIFHYLLTHGLQDLSLRPLAAAVGSNARMLNYYFGSKEEMIVEALSFAQTSQLEVLSQLPPPQPDMGRELQTLWRYFTSSQFLPFAELLFEVEAQSLRGNTLYRSFAVGTLQGWRAFVASRLEQADEPTVNLIVGSISGLLLDLVVSGDRERIDGTFGHLVKTLAEP